MKYVKLIDEGFPKGLERVSHSSWQPASRVARGWKSTVQQGRYELSYDSRAGLVARLIN